jgi:hypothetical protein
VTTDAALTKLREDLMTATLDVLTNLANRASEYPHEISETDVQALADFALERSTLADRFREQIASLHEELDAAYRSTVRTPIAHPPGYIATAERRFLELHVPDPRIRQRTIAWIIETRASTDIMTLVLRGACSVSIADNDELVFSAGERDVPALASHLSLGEG